MKKTEKIKVIDVIRDNCKYKLKHAEEQADKQLIEKYTIIDSFLLDDRCFLYVTRQEGISILEMLGYNEDEAYDLYDALTDYENVKGSFTFTDDSITDLNDDGDIYLPIGTVVLLKGGIRSLLIIGFCAADVNDHEEIYDYMGVLYPEGMINSDQIAMFNHDDIDKILHMGLINKEEIDFKKMLNNSKKP